MVAAPSYYSNALLLTADFVLRLILLCLLRFCPNFVGASLMSGRDPCCIGVQFEKLFESAPWGLPLDEATLAERFN